MMTSHQQRSEGYRTVGVLTWLLVAALSGAGHGLGRPASAGEGRSDAPAIRLLLTVHQGRLSVDLWDAEVGMVLARLAQAAGLTVFGSPIAGIRVSAQFTDAELEQGLRRLLRLASLSYAMRYARGSTGAIVLEEVRVFRPVPEETLPLLDATQHGAEERAVAPVPPNGETGEISRYMRDGPSRAGLSRTGRRPPRPGTD
jgi:hypothetical protein